MTRARDRVGAARSAGRSRLALILAAAAFSCVVAVAGCGNATSSSPGASGSAPAASGSGAEPKATRWPTGVVTAVVALGAADTDVGKFVTAWTTATNASDLEAMWGAADGFVTTLESLQPNVDRLDTYAPTKPLAAKYNAALPVLLQASKDIRDSIRGGNAKLLQDASARLVKGLETYYALRDELGGWVAESINQQKTLLQ